MCWFIPFQQVGGQTLNDHQIQSFEAKDANEEVIRAKEAVSQYSENYTNTKTFWVASKANKEDFLYH